VNVGSGWSQKGIYESSELIVLSLLVAAFLGLPLQFYAVVVTLASVFAARTDVREWRIGLITEAFPGHRSRLTASRTRRSYFFTLFTSANDY